MKLILHQIPGPVLDPMEGSSTWMDTQFYLQKQRNKGQIMNGKKMEKKNKQWVMPLKGHIRIIMK